MDEAEYEEIRRRALEPFKPSRTMDDVLKREAEIREASLAYLKEESHRHRKCKKDIEVGKAAYVPHLDYEIQYDY